MSVDVFKNTRSNIPQNDPKIVRIDFSKEDIGATKAQLAKTGRKNDYTLQHVGSR
jgi:hypothetical protein